MTPADFAAFVALCKERGMSQKQLAVILGIDDEPERPRA
jgi:transcriptional regulator with XRE-family HTH domain